MLFIGCVCADVNKQILCVANIKCFTRNTFHSYVQLQGLDMFLPKKNFNINLLSCKWVLTTLASIVSPFFYSHESELTILIAFFPAKHKHQSHFSPYRLDFSKILCQNSIKDHKKVYFDGDHFMFDGNF